MENNGDEKENKYNNSTNDDNSTIIFYLYTQIKIIGNRAI